MKKTGSKKNRAGRRILLIICAAALFLSAYSASLGVGSIVQRSSMSVAVAASGVTGEAGVIGVISASASARPLRSPRAVRNAPAASPSPSPSRAARRSPSPMPLPSLAPPTPEPVGSAQPSSPGPSPAFKRTPRPQRSGRPSAAPESGVSAPPPAASAPPPAASAPAPAASESPGAAPGASSGSQDTAAKSDTAADKPRAIDPSKPVIALTFDDGPGKYTDRLLGILKKNGAKATFCVVGQHVKSYSDVVKKASDMGHEVIGHSWDHSYLTKLSEDAIKKQLLDTSAAIEKATGKKPLMYRPPYGAINDKLKSVSKSLGYALIYWSVDPMDWKSKNANSVYNEIMKNVKDKSIILCHDIHVTTVDAMERVVPELISRGYQLVTVSELMRYNGISLEGGKVYYSGGS